MRAPLRPLAALALALALAPVAGAGASTTATTLLSDATAAAARAYANGWLDRAPVPAGAARVAHLPITLNATFRPAVFGLTDVHRLYRVPHAVDLAAFVRAHRPAGSSVDQTGYSNGPRVDEVALALACADPHVTYCELAYAATALPGGAQELRVDMMVTYLDQHPLVAPAGVTTLTGYVSTTLYAPSRGPVSATLDARQARELRRALGALRTTGGGMCMEDSDLFVVSVAHRAGTAPFWRAVGDQCPGIVRLTRPASAVLYGDRTCALRQLLVSLMPARARGSRSGLADCTP
jgi:hypothetical protein